MPLLLCPNDNAAMTTVNRGGVEFDMCPTCRGVWLDRGELEKLIAGGDAPERQAPPAAGYKRPVRSEDRPDSSGRYDRDDDGYRKNKRRDIFDIFD